VTLEVCASGGGSESILWFVISRHWHSRQHQQEIIFGAFFARPTGRTTIAQIWLLFDDFVLLGLGAFPFSRGAVHNYLGGNNRASAKPTGPGKCLSPFQFAS
jgi:hypothetical protein